MSGRGKAKGAGSEQSESGHENRLGDLADAIVASYRQHSELSHLGAASLPSREVLWAAVEDLLWLLFPGVYADGAVSTEAGAGEGGKGTVTDIRERTHLRVRRVATRLEGEIAKALALSSPDSVPGASQQKAQAATDLLLSRIPEIRDVLATDVQAAYEGDPAAQSLEEIVLAYPGLQAVAVYRVAHVLYEEEIPLIPRVMTEYAHSRTGIDIHPGAKIGRRFFVDHGTGVVIGETCTIGENVKIYQGVTLGARSFARDERGRVIKGTKRHPDIRAGVTIYSGASILGDVQIGAGSVVGGNVWLTQSVPPDTRIVIRTPQQVHLDRKIADFQI